jgi:hypothetical protein
MNDTNLLAEDRKAFRELRGLACKLLQEKVPPHERAALLRAAGHERGFSLRDGEILAITADARRDLQGKSSAATPEDEFDIPEEVWAWDQVIAARTPNLLVALQKVGKTALMAGMISAWHYGAGEFLGHPLIGPCPPVIIAGTDQTMADWRSVLAPAGLMQKQPNGMWKLTPGGPIVKLWHRSQSVYLDMSGVEEIATACEEHPGALVICDTYAALIAPLGLDEAKPEAAEPLYNLMEMVEPYGATPVLLHHASKSRANERASNASRNSNAIPAAVSQIISLQWLEPDRKGDQRINLTTEGRNSKPVDLVIEQVERSQWIGHGSAEDIKEARRLEAVESGLSDRQSDALDLVRDRWESDMQETTPPQLLALMETEYQGITRKARKTLQQLVDKKLLMKRTDNDSESGGTVIRFRPSGTELADRLARGGIQNMGPQGPQSPQRPMPSQSKKESPLSPEPSEKDPADPSDPEFGAPRARDAVRVPPVPTLNSSAAAVWSLIRAADPGEAAHTLSLRIELETGVRMNGAQVKALIAQGPPPELQGSETF